MTLASLAGRHSSSRRESAGMLDGVRRSEFAEYIQGGRPPTSRIAATRLTITVSRATRRLRPPGGNTMLNLKFADNPEVTA